MAGALTADVAVVFDPSRNIGLRQAQSNSADTYYRGGMAFYTAGQLDLTPAETVPFAGVLMEHKVTAASAEMIWIATGGRFHFSCVKFTLANMEVAFAMQVGDLFDAPANLDVSGASDSAVTGVLDQVTADAVSGWLDISRRLAGTNA